MVVFLNVLDHLNISKFSSFSFSSFSSDILLFSPLLISRIFFMFFKNMFSLLI